MLIEVYATTFPQVFHNLFDGRRPIMTLWYVCVSKEVRRKGVGRLLFREIEKIARENDCEIIYFTCLQENTRAQNFYRSLGYMMKRKRHL